MALHKNVASQKLLIFAWDTANLEPKTGDSGNITAFISKDGGGAVQSIDVNPTELDAVDLKGIYVFDLDQAETNCDLFVLKAVSATADIEINPVVIYTVVRADYMADVSALALQATALLIKTETDKIQPSIIAVPGNYMADVTALALQATALLIKTETDKIQPSIIAVPDTYKADVSALALEATAQLIKTETDKIPTILTDTNEIQTKLPDNNIMGSGVKTDKDDEIDDIKTETDKIQPDIIAVPSNYKADVSNLDVAVSTRSSHTAANVWAVGVRTLTSFGTLVADVWTNAIRTLTAGTKDAEIDAIKLETDKIQPDIIAVPSNYKADVSALALEATAQLIKTETDKIIYILGLVQENFRLKNQVYNAAGNLTGATIRIYGSAADCDADLNEIAEYTMTASYDLSGNCTNYRATKV